MATPKCHEARRTVSALVAAAFAASLCTATHAQITYLKSFGSPGSADGQFIYTNAIAAHPNGTVYVVDSGNSRVQVFSPTGTFLRAFGTAGSGPGQFNGVCGVTVAHDGNVLVTDSTNNRIQVFTPDGAFVTSFGSGQLFHPQAAKVAPSGNIYVTDHDNYRVAIFNPGGAFLSSFGTRGTAPGQFDGPFSVAINSAGNVYVTDTNNNRVQIFNANGVFQSSFGSVGTNLGQFRHPFGIEVSRTDNLYVGDFLNNRVQVFNPDGTSRGSFGSFGSGPGQFWAALNIAVTPSGILYVTDWNNNRPQRWFDPTAWVSGTNTFTDPTLGPTSIAIGTAGSLLTINAAMNLVVGNTTTVNAGSTLIQNGGSISTGTLTVAGSFLYQSGPLTAATLSIPAAGHLAVGPGQTAVFAGTAANSNAGALSLASSSLVTASTLSNAGTISLSGNSAVHAHIVNTPSGIIHLSPGGPNVFHRPVSNLGTLTVDAGASGTFYGPYTGDGPIVNHGSLYLNASSITGPITGTGALTVGSPASPVVVQLLPGAGESAVASITIYAASSLDLTSNALTTRTPVTTLRGYLLNNQISSSLSDATHSLAYATTDGATRLELALTGDANLDGVLNSDDYTLVDRSLALSRSGALWTDGDFNYDGTVTTADYLLIDATFAKQQGGLISPSLLAQRASQFGPDYASQLLTSIPEPSLALSSILYPLSSLLLKRRPTSR